MLAFPDNGPDSFTATLGELQRAHAEILNKMLQMGNLVRSVCHEHQAELAKYQQTYQKTLPKQASVSFDISQDIVPAERLADERPDLQVFAISCLSEDPHGSRLFESEQPRPSNVQRLEDIDRGNAPCSPRCLMPVNLDDLVPPSERRSKKDSVPYAQTESESHAVGRFSSGSTGTVVASSSRDSTDGSATASDGVLFRAAEYFKSYGKFNSARKVTVNLSESDLTHNRWRKLTGKLLLFYAGAGRRVLRPEWSDAFDPDSLTASMSVTGKVQSIGFGSAATTKEKLIAGSSVQSPSRFQICFLHPEGALARLVLCLSTCALSYDLITLPYFLCFAIKNRMVSAVDFTLVVFWTCAMVISCVTGYHSQHVVEMRPHRVMRHYWTTWGILDLILLTSDWLGVLLAQDEVRGGDHTSSWLSLGRALKYYRFLRVLRMLRLLKLMQLLRAYVDSLAAEVTLVLLRLFCNVLFVFLVNHYIACVWCALSYYNTTDDSTWSGAMSLERSQTGYMYLVALHWSMTQFTPATNNIFPTNIRERVFASFVVLFGLIIFSSFIGSLTSAIAQLKKIHLDRYSEEVRIRKFIIERHVSLQCARGIWNFYRQTHGTSSAANICLDDVSCFRNLPKVTRVRLLADISMPIITKHPLFAQLDLISNEALLKVCEEALAELGLQTNEEVFAARAAANHMHFLNSGSVVYEREDLLSSLMTLPSPSFISEASLWTVGLYRGTMRAVTASHMLKLEAKSFARVLRRTCPPHVAECFCTYARSFMDWIVQCMSDGTGVTDIVHPKDAKLYNKLCRRFSEEACGMHIPGRATRMTRVSRHVIGLTKSPTKSFGSGMLPLRVRDNTLSSTVRSFFRRSDLRGSMSRNSTL